MAYDKTRSVARGGTGATSAGDARTNLGLGSIATQDSDAVSITGGSITGIGTPSAASDVAIKSYVDGLVNGASWKDPADLATTGNITLSGEQTIDGDLTSASTVLVWQQTDQTENGVYLTAAGAWSRVTQWDEGSDFPSSALFIKQGATYGDKQFVCTNNSAPNLGSDNITFVQFGASVTYTGSSGVDVTGTVISLDLDTLSAAAVDVANDSIAIIDAGDGSSKKESVADLATAMAGTSMSASGGQLSVNAANFVNFDPANDRIVVRDETDQGIKALSTNNFLLDITEDEAGGLTALNSNIIMDINGLTAAVVDVANDSLAIVDANDSNRTRKESVADLMSAVAGDGIAATSGVLAADVDDSTIGITGGQLEVKDGGITPGKANLTNNWQFDGVLTANGGLKLKVTSYSTTTNIAATDVVAAADSSGGAITLTLPAAATVGLGAIIIVKDTSGSGATNNITIDGNASEDIDGNATLVINGNYDSYTLMSDGSGSWSII